MQKEELKTLVDISKLIAEVKDKEELLKLIIDKIKPIFHFHDIGLFIVNEEEDYHIDWAAEMPGISPSEANQLYFDNQYGKIPHKGTPVEWIMSAMQSSGEPALFDFKDLVKRFPAYPKFHLLEENYNYRDCLAATLQVGGETMGMFCINALEAGFFKQHQFPLFCAITDQLSLAVRNILSHEQVLKEQGFKETLLNISEVIAKVKDKESLLKLIIDKIQPIFKFYDVGLFIVNEAENYHIDWAAEMPTISPSDGNWLHNKNDHKKMPHRGSSIEQALSQLCDNDTPLIQNYDDLVRQFPSYPQFKVMRELGYRECLVAPLQSGGLTIGLFCINSLEKGFFNPAQFSLFQAITDQLAVAISNILANEQMLEEQHFKETLLSTSEVIAKVKDRESLLKLIIERIKPIFQFHNVGLFVVNEAENYHIDWAVEMPNVNPALDTNRLLYENECGEKMAHNGSVVEWVMSEINLVGAPVLFDFKDLIRRFPSYPQFLILKDMEFRDCLATTLQVGGQVIGMFCINSFEKDFFRPSGYPLFQAIADQLAIAVNNVQVNAELKAREMEENVKVTLVDAVNGGQNWEDKLLNVTQVLKKYFSFQVVSFGLLSRRITVPWLHFDEVAHDEFRALDEEAFLNVTQTSKKSLLDYAEYLERALSEPTIFNEQSFDKLVKFHKVYRALHQAFHIQGLLAIPLRLNESETMIVSFYSSDPSIYQTTDIKFFKRIASSFSLAVEKQLHYLEVVQLNELIAQENVYLEKELQVNYNFGEIIGSSNAMREVFEKVQQVANTNSNVLISGETGTGKELIARALHNYSHRAKHNFIKLNCATLPAELLESELFGHEKGAFTGAHQRRIGKFELANKGTIFLDEIGEIPLELQAKLLRVLQEREFERLGSNELIRPDVRVVAATNRELQQEALEGRFRSDLFYRLNVYPVHLPPLRERKEDIPELAQHFIQKHQKRIGKRIKKLSDDSIKSMLSYHWPGNIRELEHTIERAMITSKTSTLEIRMDSTATMHASTGDSQTALKTYKQGEVDLIMNTLRHTNGKISGVGGAAEILDINRATLESKMRKFGITKKHVLESMDKKDQG
ncbi:MAG: sigma 54-interacting transcriptional regulator [Cytophagales bacterium]|nr:sigma 54-interacting transcriptional regulator [Cytophagales bacterium]